MGKDLKGKELGEGISQRSNANQNSLNVSWTCIITNDDGFVYPCT
jgi:hypothetical protein